ncbi:MAG: hypothetical protein METHP_00289 [Methanoregula sp. SKADARSKE-2]|nr:MAG: hypothetical protein METHP_00289 [Methanoregula sp. SKADARSKE-2]
MSGGKNLTIEQQLFSVISWLAVIALLLLSLYPSLKKIFGSSAFPASFSASILIFTLITWYCGLARLPVQLGLLPFLLLFGYHVGNRHYRFAELKGEWHWVALFFFCFFLMIDLRFVNPTISYAEKFMDHAFLESIIRNPVVPPLDPWFSGRTLNVYYYLGYWIFGCLAIVSGVPSGIAFNLALPTVFALAAINVYAIGTHLLERFRWMPLLLFFIPNPSFFWQFIQGRALPSALWDSTRTIINTINEYPLFSFVWGDVHAHVISIFNQVFLLFLLLFAYKHGATLGSLARWFVTTLIILSLGAMPLINTWDVLIYAPTTMVAGAWILWRGHGIESLRRSGKYLLVIPSVAILLYLPFYLELQTHTGGIGIVRTPSDPVEFLLVNGFFIALILVFLAKDIARRPYLLGLALPFLILGYYAAAVAAIPVAFLSTRIFVDKKGGFPDILAISGLGILLLCELFFLKDNMGDTYFRMNTVFKAYLPAWIMLGIASFSMAGKWLAVRIPVLPSKITAVLLVLVIGGLFLLPPVVSYNSGYGTGTLDGIAYLNETHPGDAAAINYLRTLPGNEQIVEAEGGDYSYCSRVSSFTGIPAIIGMPFHEFMWRSDDTSWFDTRKADIKAIYEKPEKTIPLMKKYNATLLYVGDSEREKYTVNITRTGLEKVYSAQGTDIYHLSPSG